MGHATGLGLGDTALLLAVDGPRPTPGYRRSSSILRRFAAETGEDPLDGYAAMASLCRPWLSPLPLLDGRGNWGSPGNDPAADATYTECRLSPAGRAAADAERGTGPPLPLGLVNGSTFRGGLRPPFDPARVATAVLAVAAGGSPDGAALSLGLPAFPGGATPAFDVNGRELEHLRRGWHAGLSFDSVIQRTEDRGRPALDVVALPPYANPDEICTRVAELANAAQGRSLIRDLQDLTSMHTGLRLRFVPSDEVPPAAAEEFLRRVPGIGLHLYVQLSAPLADLLRRWVTRHGKKAAAAGAAVLRELADVGP